MLLCVDFRKDLKWTGKTGDSRHREKPVSPSATGKDDTQCPMAAGTDCVDLL